MEIHLSIAECIQAAVTGVFRHLEAKKAGLDDKHGLSDEDGKGIGVHVDGAAGEIAFARAMGVYYSPTVNTFKVGGDVAGIEVRTRSKTWYELIVRPDDNDGAAFVLVVGTMPHYTVKGWIRGSEAKREEWLKTHGNRPPAYFVPHDALTTEFALLRRLAYSSAPVVGGKSG